MKPIAGQKWLYTGRGRDEGKVVGFTILGVDASNGEVHMRPDDIDIASTCSFAKRDGDPKRDPPPEIHLFFVPLPDPSGTRKVKGNLTPGDCYANAVWSVWDQLVLIS